MNLFSKIIFWTSTIILGFVNPLISVGMVILYYLPGIIQSTCSPCDTEQVSSKMNSLSEHTKEDMR